MKKMSYFWRRGLWTMLSISLLLLGIFGLLYIYLENHLPPIASLDNVNLQVPLRIYSNDKKLIAEYGEKRRIPVNYKDIPLPLINALLTTEDQRFFEHAGVDIYGLGRAVIKLLKTGRKSQGGSTITMQVARNFFLSRKKTYLRKFNEILLAIKIDNELSKEKILELYLNKIYLGNRAYGVGAAAKVYYGKKLNQLTLAEMAMIAGLPQAPSSNNPLKNPKAALKRRNHVLKRMYELHKINYDEYLEAHTSLNTARFHERKVELYAPYVAEMIRHSLFKHFNKSAYEKGYKVYTTIDSQNQKKANEAIENAILSYDLSHGYRGPLDYLSLPLEESEPLTLFNRLKPYSIIHKLIPGVVTQINDEVIEVYNKNKQYIQIPFNAFKWVFAGHQSSKKKAITDVLSIGSVIYTRKINKVWHLSQLPEIEAALISLSPENGAILALSGGFNFMKSKFNRVTQAHRQPGSTIKPFIYAAALEKGLTMASIINDAPIVLKDPNQENLWRPHNDNNKFYGPTPLRTGLIRSRNLVSIRVLKAAGLSFAIHYLKLFGFSEESLPNSLSLALGSSQVTPMQLAAAYAVLANGGYKVEPHIINRITDPHGQIILKTLPQMANAIGHSIPISQQAPQVINSSIAYLITSALKDVIQKGTGQRAKSLNRQDLAGKTGTTNDQRDAWFSGFNFKVVTTTWMGFDSPKNIKAYASSTALPLWIDYMSNVLAGTKESNLKMPSNIISVRINPHSGLRSKKKKDTQLELFRKENLPDFEENNYREEDINNNHPDNLF